MFPISDTIPTPRFPIVNILLILVTVFIFFQQATAFDPEAFIYTYSLIPSRVDLNNFSSLMPFVTAIFLHGGLLHIVSNMWFLWVFGDNVEGHINSFFYIILYFVSGIIGNIVQYLFMPNSPIPMLGASGAVAGILGAYFVLFPHAHIKTFFPIVFFITIVQIPATLMLGYWFVLQIISGASSLPFSESGGIAFWAHAGGFVTGVIFAKLLQKEGKVEYE